MSEQHAYPLAWPAGWQRTPTSARERGTFEGTQDRVRKDLLEEVNRIALGGRARTHTIMGFVVISTNMPLRRDGFPSASSSEPADPGVAVYFTRKKNPVCFACDKYDRVWKNMRAIQKSIEALRGLERWGSSQLLERAFNGFSALPEKTGPSCWDILGLGGAVSSEPEIIAAFRQAAMRLHPDMEGGSHEAFASLNQAKDIALQTVRSGRTS